MAASRKRPTSIIYIKKQDYSATTGGIYCRTPCGDRPPPPRFEAWLCDFIGKCCRHSVEWAMVFGWFLAMFWYLGASCNCHANSCPQACGGMVFASKWCPKWKQNGSQMAPRRPPGASWHPQGLLETSWRSLGAAWEASWALLGRS